MSVPQLISHLRECGRQLSNLQARQDHVALSCSILRLEGEGGRVLHNLPFARVLGDRPYYPRLTIGLGDSPFALAFYSSSDKIQPDRIRVALSAVEAITTEICQLLEELPRPIRECLQLPPGDDWWRILFHLAWHLPRPFLRATRWRLLAHDGAPAGRSDERSVQLHGTDGRSDLLPGLIYSELGKELCICSEAAVGVIIEALEQYAQMAGSRLERPHHLSPDQRQTFDRLRAEFLAGAQPPGQAKSLFGGQLSVPLLECKLLKLADSFESPPAMEWAGLKMGGCAERMLVLSRLNDLQEVVQIRGAATEWFCELAERAGSALPGWIPDLPILFDDFRRTESGISVGVSGPPPVMNRSALKRWVGFVFATLKYHGHEALQVRWGTEMGPLSYGLATLDRDLCAASVVAIDLAGLTTALTPIPANSAPLVKTITGDSTQVDPSLYEWEDGAALSGKSKADPRPVESAAGTAVRGLFRFYLPAIFHCAVELGTVINDQADGAASREAEITGERLLHVLNPRDAKFPSNFEWADYRARREIDADWRPDIEPRPGWSQELELADCSAAARQALLTIGLGLTDLRGDCQWHSRGWELLSAGTWNLWAGMGTADRNAVRHLLPETNRLWQWPADLAGEPAVFTGPTATMSEPRVLTLGWRTATAAAVNAANDTLRIQREQQLREATGLYATLHTRAPEGVPSPLAAAYETLAVALVHACYLKLQILPAGPQTRLFPLELPWGRLTIEEAARQAVREHDQARAAYRGMEVLLRAAIEAGSICIYAEALGWIERVASTCERALAAQLPWDQAAATIYSVPAVSPARILEDMRRQTSRAAVQMGAPTGHRPSKDSDGPKSDGDHFVFRQEVAVWLVCFAGESGHFPVSGNKGLKYLADLLSRPYRRLSGLELQGRSDEATRTEHTFQEVSDDETRTRVLKEAEDVAHRIEEARRNNDLAAQERWQIELGELAEHLQSSEGLHSRQRRLGPAPPAVKAFDAVRRNIDRIRKRLQEHLPGLVAHLEACIRSESASFMYMPAYDPLHPNPGWEF
jgi:hypothetical protein